RSANREFQEVETLSFVLNNVSVTPLEGEVVKTFGEVEITVTVTAKQDILDPGVYVSIGTTENVRLAGLDFKDFTTIPKVRAGETIELGFVVDELPLLAGTYQLE